MPACWGAAAVSTRCLTRGVWHAGRGRGRFGSFLFRVWSAGGCPSGGGLEVEAEHGEPGQVVGGGEEVEVGVDFGSAPDPGSPPAVAAAHQMAEFAFDFGSSSAVVGDPDGVVSLASCSGETVFIAADRDATPTCGFGAL